ncbi:MAG: FG-GAP-like repeat-containing protein, partial [Actinomycetota bacterium]|nr:FG-GAP-like repeat-containing protein [Actinomycetota bacterium]
GLQPHSIDVADLDNDGALDLAIAARGDNAAAILLGNGDGTFGTVTGYPVGPGGPGGVGVTGPKNLALEYFDDDGYLDIVSANQDNGTAGVIISNGDGSFGPYTPYATSYGTHDVAVGDFNNDDRIDFITVPWENPPAPNLATLWLGDGDGRFSSPTTHAAGTSPHGIVAAHFDNDGNLDFATSAQGDSAAIVRAGNGNGTFAAPVIHEAKSGGLAHDIAMGDFDEDGDEDLVIAAETSDELSVFFGGPGTDFSTYTPYSVAEEPKGVAVGDLNNDGHRDLIATSVVAHYPDCDSGAEDPLTFLMGDGNGNFSPGGSINVGEAPFDAAVADFNGDGWNDLAAPSWCDDNVSIYLNLGTGGPIGSFSTESGVATAPDAPAAPTATTGDATATVNWSTPASDGGSAVLGYDLELEDLTTPGTTPFDVGLVLTKSVNSLTNGDSYRARVRASNAVGDGPWSAWSATFVPNGAPPSGTFVDDDSSIFEADIEWLAAEGITSGCNPPGNDRFCPDDNVTRGQMAAFLVRALDLTDGGTVDFVDDDSSIFESDIEKLAAAGITHGCNPPGNDRFCPEDNVTRGQMAAFLVRALDLTDRGTVDFIDDDNSIFESQIEKLAAAGITQGCNPPANDRFCPEDNVTRGQMAAFLRRAIG